MASNDATRSREERERTRVTAQELSWALRDVTLAAVDVDYAMARRVGLRPMDFVALNHILVNEGSLSPYALSQRLGISTGSTSELIDRLERSGHAERHRVADDRRRVSLAPTTTAVERVLTELAPLLATLEDIASDYTAEQRDLIADYLRRVSRAMHDHGEPDAGDG